MAIEPPFDLYARDCYTKADQKEKDSVPMFCPFNRTNGQFAFVDETLLENDRFAPTSAFKEKKTDAYCLEVKGRRQNLLPGRYCKDGWHCSTSLCNKRESICMGRSKDQSCISDHDCGNGLYCRKSTNWPFQTLCS